MIKMKRDILKEADETKQTFKVIMEIVLIEYDKFDEGTLESFLKSKIENSELVISVKKIDSREI